VPAITTEAGKSSVNPAINCSLEKLPFNEPCLEAHRHNDVAKIIVQIIT